MDPYSLNDILINVQGGDLVSASSMQTNVFNAWSRPTQGWKLEFEQQGKTRADAYEKTLLTIALSGSEFHIWNCGVALVVMFPIIMCACIVTLFVDK